MPLAAPVMKIALRPLALDIGPSPLALGALAARMGIAWFATRT
jgi:hypothetical protein